jgi:hypothetical protein
MNDAGTLPRHMVQIRELTAEAFAPYGRVIAPLRMGDRHCSCFPSFTWHYPN